MVLISFQVLMDKTTMFLHSERGVWDSLQGQKGLLARENEQLAKRVLK